MARATQAEIAQAARIIREGGLVAFPTETVYGLGANALDAEAIARIYAVKCRPATSPLIVHVSSIEMAKQLVDTWSKTADLSATKFWPGPLTLVLPTAYVVTGLSPVSAEQSEAAKCSRIIPPIVTAGLHTVGLRMPAHPIAQALIAAAGVPIAAPSANRFTELSPTAAEHVRNSLGNEVDYILDGGPCKVGIESTVLSLVDAIPVLLRPGAISREDLEGLIGPISSAQEVKAGPHPSPGMHPRHYSPRTTLLLVENGKVPATGRGVYLQQTNPPKRSDTNAKITTIQMPQCAPDYAAALYKALHEADAVNVDWIAVDSPPNMPEWEAIQDRLHRAAASDQTGIA